MTYTLFWRTKTYLDLDEAFAWYADHAPLQVNRLENEIAAAEQEIRESPLMYRRMLKDTRRDPETYQRRFI